MKANKIVSGVLALTMVLGGLALPAEVSGKAGFGSAISAEAETYGDFEYSVLDDGTVEITKYTGSGPSVTIPSKINGKTVTGISFNAFMDCTSIEKITIPDSVTFIEDEAFSNCTSLTNITIPDSVTSLGAVAFAECSSLKSIKIPDGVKEIGAYTFSGCTSLTSVTIPDSVLSIGYWSFYECESLKNITLSNSLTFINSQAFQGCTSLTNIVFPDSLNEIASNAFYDCTSLSYVVIPKDIEKIDSLAFSSCNNLKDVYYKGSESDWNKITNEASHSINENSGIKDATIHYNYNPDETSVGKAVTTKFSCTDTAIRINWKKVSNASGYRIYRYNTSTKKWNTAATLSGADNLTYKQTGLKSGTTYKYKVKAYAKSNGKTYWGEPSDTMTTTTNPSKPVIKSYGATSNAVRINWNTVTGATGYRVYRYDTKTKKYAVIATIRDGSANTYRDSGRKAKTSYQYKVKAYRKVNNVNYWSEASAAKTCKTK